MVWEKMRRKIDSNIPKVIAERGAEVLYRLENLYWLGVMEKGFMSRSSDSLPEVLAVVLLRPAAADVESRCGACNISCHGGNSYGKS